MRRLARRISTDKRANMKHGGQSSRQQCIHTIPQQWKASVLNEILVQVQQLTDPQDQLLLLTMKLGKKVSHSLNSKN